MLTAGVLLIQDPLLVKNDSMIFTISSQFRNEEQYIFNSETKLAFSEQENEIKWKPLEPPQILVTWTIKGLLI